MANRPATACEIAAVVAKLNAGEYDVDALLAPDAKCSDIIPSCPWRKSIEDGFRRAYARADDAVVGRLDPLL